MRTVFVRGVIPSSVILNIQQQKTTNKKFDYTYPYIYKEIPLFYTVLGWGRTNIHTHTTSSSVYHNMKSVTPEVPSHLHSPQKLKSHIRNHKTYRHFQCLQTVPLSTGWYRLLISCFILLKIKKIFVHEFSQSVVYVGFFCCC